jgi:thiamine pyrophosphate-dependent acetolactate synthase large subunit-like protein
MKGTRIDGGTPTQIGNDLLPPAVEQRIGQATRPVVIAGALATRRSWRNNLAKLNIPVFTTFAGKGFDETASHTPPECL